VARPSVPGTLKSDSHHDGITSIIRTTCAMIEPTPLTRGSNACAIRMMVHCAGLAMSINSIQETP
jgi:hypothetical protein